MSTLFISDLHLSPSRPELTRCFLDFVHQHAVHAEALYVLGDLFDFWLGDNDNSEFACQIRDAFRFLTSRGVACYFCHGNRDFLVGKRFAKETGVTLLDTEHRISLYGREAVVLHGDTLCTDDQQYLEFRAKVHQPWLQWLFIRIPMFIRKKIVADIQGKAKESKHNKELSIMDVNAEEVVNVMNRHGVDLMIHGHTHRPATHSLATEQGESERIVLPDWNELGYALSISPDERRELIFPVK